MPRERSDLSKVITKGQLSNATCSLEENDNRNVQSSNDISWCYQWRSHPILESLLPSKMYKKEKAKTKVN